MRWTVVAVAMVAAFGVPARAQDQDAEMRRLFAAYERFKDTPEFRRFGYIEGGPFHAWAERVQALVRDRSFSLNLMTRCNVLPFDLWSAGVTAYKGETDAARTATEAAFATCYKGSSPGRRRP